MRGIIVGEAASREDLRAWARRLDETTLAVGGAEFFTAILEARGHKPHVITALPPGEAHAVALFVCGSASASTDRFLGECKCRGWPVLPLPVGLLQDAVGADELVRAWANDIRSACGRHRHVVVAIDQPPVAECVASRHWGEHLISAVKMALAASAVDQIFVEGGATAAALLRAMDWRRMEVVRELAPGVVTMRIESDASMTLTIKPGSYVWPG